MSCASLAACRRCARGLAFPPVRPAALVPGEGLSHRHQQPAAHLRAVAELRVLPSVAVKGLVAAADGVVE